MSTKLNQVKYIFIHHTAISYSANPDQWNATAENHKERFNMLSSMNSYVGYNYEISAAGLIRQSRQEGEETAAVISYNFNSVSICLDGNFDIELPTQAQIDALTTLIIGVMARHSVPLENIHPHRFACDVPPYKSCYGNKLSDTWAQDLITQSKLLNNSVKGIDDVSKNEC